MSVPTDPLPASAADAEERGASRPPGADESLSAGATAGSLVRRHLAIGWWGLLVFLTLGIVIEGFHGFKTRWYADEGMDLRQTMLRLAHAHGGMLAIVHLLFAGTLRWMGSVPVSSMAIASKCLTVALLLVPGGFFLGGFFLLRTGTGMPNEPGVGVFLVPIGAVFLVTGIVLTARAQREIGRD